MESRDQHTTLEQLKEVLRKFRDDRDWVQFHKPKDLAAAISIEAGELQEHFLWKSEEQIAEYLSDPAKKGAVIEELMDVFNYALCLANVMDVDVASSSLRKIEKNSQKYPVEKARGSAKKYSEL